MGIVSEQKRTCFFIGGVFGLAAIATLVALPIVLMITGEDDPVACAGSCTLDDVPLVDGHNDLPFQIYNLEKNLINDFKFDSDLTADPIWANRHTDLLRLRKGKVGAQFWAAYVSCATTQAKDAVERTLEQIDIIKRLVRKYSDDMTFVTTSNGIWDAYKENKIGSLIGIEGGHSMDNRLAVLRMYYDLGVRYMTLTHSCNQPWVDASPVDDDTTGTKLNLTTYGENVITEMNRLGMIVDLSHVSYGVMNQVLDISRAPVIFSHSSAYSVFAHHRNVQDDILEKLKENAGVIMINFYPAFTGGDDMAQVIKHINHVRDTIGSSYVGIGGDYDGVNQTPTDLKDVSQYPDLFEKLAEDGNGWKPWTGRELQNLAGKNIIRVLMEVENVKEEMKNMVPVESLIPTAELLAVEPDQSCRTDLVID